MSVILSIAVLTIAYAAWPHRGRSVPGAGWLDDVFERVHEAVPVIDDAETAGRPGDAAGDLSVTEPAATRR